MLDSIERIEWFRAFVRSVDTDVTWGKLSDAEKLTPDFARIANEESFSVETGHQLLRVSLPLEYRGIRADLFGPPARLTDPSPRR